MENKNMNNSLTLKNFLNMRTDSDFNVDILFNWNGLKEEYDCLKKIKYSNIDDLPAEMLNSTVYDFHIVDNDNGEALLVVGTSYFEENSNSLAETISDKDFIEGYKKEKTQNLYLKIVERAKVLGILRPENDIIGALMDIESADMVFHLKLEDFLNAGDFEFIHDFAGIQSHIVRNGYPATDFNFFLPRFAREETKEAE